MKKFLLALVLALAWAAPSYATWSQIAHVACGSTGAGNVTCDNGGGGLTTTGANFIIVLIVDAPTMAGGATALTDSKGNVYNCTDYTRNADTLGSKLCYIRNPVVGTGHTFTGTVTNATAPCMAILAYSGNTAGVTLPFDQTNGNGATTGTTLTTGSITPGVDGELIVTGIGWGAAYSAATLSSGMATGDIVDTVTYSGGNHFGCGIAAKVQTTAAAINPQWGWTTSVSNVASIVSFRDSVPTVYTATASDCDNDTGAGNNHVQLAVDSVDTGDIVRIPAGDCTWTSPVTITKGISLLGAGEASTTIRDGIAAEASIVISSNNNFRLGGFSFAGSTAKTGSFASHIQFSGNATGFRMDHITFTNPQSAVTFVDMFGCLYGLIDHNTVTSGNQFMVHIRATNCGGSDYGDYHWGQATRWGSASGVYLEQNTFNSNSTSVVNLTDIDAGAYVVIRYNTFNYGAIGSHGTDSGNRTRSLRNVEIYGNVFNYDSTTSLDFVFWQRGGTGRYFYNAVNNVSNVTGTFNSFVRNFVCRLAGSGCGDNPTPWGTCNGSNAYDGNESGLTGYRCVDQGGAGRSDDLAGVTTPTAQSINQLLDPEYAWANTASTAPGLGAGFITFSDHVVSDRDGYAQASGIQTNATTPFNGTTGTGWGTNANRPTTCTFSSTLGNHGVAYWETDTGGNWKTQNLDGSADTNANDGQLFLCTATDTWTASYTPYTFPHPLNTSASGTSTGFEVLHRRRN